MTYVRTMATLLVLIVSGACGGTQAPQALDASNDLLLMSTSTGVASIKPGGRSPAFRSDAGVPSGDWSSVVTTHRDGKSTQLVGVDPATGAQLWQRGVEGNLRPKVVSPKGRFVALVPADARYAEQPRVTKITISGRDVEDPTTIHLDGNFEPEAFSTDGRVLFVVQYLPAGAPTRYQVRQLNVATGVVGDVFSVDKELQEAMRGTARVQEMSSDGKRLYTLYSTRTRHGEHSFIHVLSLDELWAHCIDLPQGFGMSGDSKTAVGLHADGHRLYVADTLDGGVVEVDTERLKVLREAEIDELAGSTGATLAVDEADDAFYVGAGNRVRRIGIEDLALQREWELPGRIRGLQIADESRRLYIGLNDEIGIVDLTSNEVLEPLDPPGVEAIDTLGPVTPGLDPAREKFSCAC